MMYTFVTAMKPTGLEEAWLSQDLYYWSGCLRDGLGTTCKNLRKANPDFDLYAYLSETYNLTSQQVNSITQDIEAMISSAHEGLKYQQKSLAEAIETREKAIAKKEKSLTNKLKKEPYYLKSKKGMADTCWLDGKKQALELKKASLADVDRRLKEQDYSITLGGKAHFAKRTSSVGVSADFDATRWRSQWQESREYFRYSVGDKHRPGGNLEIQYNLNASKVRIRLTDEIADIRLAQLPPKAPRLPAKFLEIDTAPIKSLLKFASKHGTTPEVLLKDKPVTTRIFRKEGVYYLALTVDIEVTQLPKVVAHPKSCQNILGLDFNANGIAWSVVKPDGNNVTGAYGFIELPEVSEFTISNALTQLFKDTKKFGVGRVAIENLDFFKKKAHMRSGIRPTGKRYNKMLSSLAYSQFSNLVIRKTALLGLKVSLVNPTYSSVAGFVRFAYRHNTSADIGAAVMIARQALRGEVYRKKDDLEHVSRNKLKLEAVEVLSPHQMMNRWKSHGRNLRSWKSIATTLGYRSQWRANLSKWLVDQETAVLDGHKKQRKKAKTSIHPEGVLSNTSETDFGVACETSPHINKKQKEVKV